MFNNLNLSRAFVAAAAVFALSSPAIAQEAAPQTPTEAPGLTAQNDAPMIIAQVNGLVCDFCAQALNKVFLKEEGVASLEVDLDSGEVRVALVPGGKLTDERVGKLIRKSGYSLVSIDRSGGA